MNSKEQIDKAMGLHRSGDFGAAEIIYRQVLQREPTNPDALHLLGVLASQCGNNGEAVDLIRRALWIKPNYAEAYRNLATVLAQMNRFDEAIEAYRTVLRMRPNNADAHREMGVFLREAGKKEEAAVEYSKAAELQPNSAEAQRNMGKALTMQGKHKEAIEAYRRAIALKPDWMDAHFNLAEAYQNEGRLSEALQEYQRILEIKPDMVEAQNNLANTLRDLGRWDEAIEAYLQAIKLKPENPALHYNLGRALMSADRIEESLLAFGNAIHKNRDHYESYASMAIALGKLKRFDEARQCQKAAAGIAPEAACTHQAMGEIFLHMLDGAGAVTHFRRATEADPNNISLWTKLAEAYEAQGNFDEAAACYRHILEINPDCSAGYKGLAGLGRSASKEMEINRLEAVLNDPNVSIHDRVGGLFGLGKALDDLDRYDEAFARYAEGNALQKDLRRQTGEQYDPEAMKRQTDELIEVFTRDFFEQRRDWGNPSEVPVFVVGMPRSGTTLTQQIAASHPQVHGAGELTEIPRIAKSLGVEDARSAAYGWTRQAIADAVEKHLIHLRDLSGTADRIVDKMPGNVRQLGLIAVMYPNARVVLCRRDPRDNCLSCYFQMFTTGNLYSYDLAHCGSYQVETDRLMEHWKKTLPLRMLEFQYESVVEDLEGQSRRLIDFLGLPWDPKCLEFHKTQNTILTASVWQVRQPIYKDSVGRWRHYEKHLGPLLEVLRQAGAI